MPSNCACALFSIFFLHLNSLVYSEVEIPEQNRILYASPRVVMLGGAGVGKSTLANSLLGREKDFRNEDGECFEAGNPKSGSGGMTKEACAHQGHFLANETLPELTVIDTPGLGMESLEEQESIEQIVNILKTVEYVHTFAFLIKENSNRATRERQSIIRLYTKIFGSKFLKNVVLVATFWGYSQDAELARDHTQESWLEAQKSLSFKDMDYSDDLRAIYFTPRHKLSRDYWHNATTQLTRLYHMSRDNDPFHCKDIDIVLDDWTKAQEEIEKLKNETRKKDEELKKLDECQQAKKNLTILEGELRARGRRKDDQIQASSLKMIGTAIGCILLGVILGFCLYRYYTHQCSVDSYDSEEDLENVKVNGNMVNLENTKKSEKNTITETEQLNVDVVEVD